LTLFQVFRASPKPATQPPDRPSHRPTPAATPAVEVISVEAWALAKAWRAAERRLVVTTQSPVGRGRRVVVNVSGVGGVSLSLTGSVTAARATGGTCHAEIAVDEDRLPVVERILGFLAGNAEALKARAPRYKLALPAVVSSEAGHTYMNTFSVSQAGCGLAWSGPPPRQGRGVLIRLGSGTRTAAFRALIAWVRTDAKGLRVGLRFLAGEETKLTAMLGEAQRGAAAN